MDMDRFLIIYAAVVTVIVMCLSFAMNFVSIIAGCVSWINDWVCNIFSIGNGQKDLH